MPILAGVWGVSEMVLLLLRRSPPGSSKDKNSLKLIWVADGVGISGAFFFHYMKQSWAMPASEGLLWAALLFLVVGIVIRVHAIVYLGKFFTTNVAIADDHRLVDGGPFRYVRHPSYTGGMLSFLGFALSLTNWASLVIMLVPVYAAFLWRIHVEEQALLGAFGEQYKEYMKRTKRLVPGVY